MLKRGGNRPAHAVLVAESKATQASIAKTFGRGRSVIRQGPRCPFPACPSSPEPIFCEAHWKLLDGTMRRELLTELRALTAKGQRSASPKMRELFKRAIEELQVALYKRAGATTREAHERVEREARHVLGPDGQPVSSG